MFRSTPTAICACSHSLFLSSEGNVFSCGRSIFGVHGHEDNQLNPKSIPTLENIISIVGSLNHSVCLDMDGNVYTFGSNDFSQLGKSICELISTHIPQKMDIPRCLQVSCGYNFTICLCEDGFLYSLGYNRNGELGIGKNEVLYTSPQKIESIKGIEFIECGGSHTFCKTLNNEIYCWGRNHCGQLGLVHSDNQNIPVLCSTLLNEDIDDIKCGREHTLVLTANGDVLSCGNNLFGKLGRRNDGDNETSFQKISSLSNITRIECGYLHSMCIDMNGDLYVFGYNENGQLGLGDVYGRYEPVKHPTLSNVIDISSKGECTFVKTSNNEIYAFGKNLDSQLEVEQKEEASGIIPNLVKFLTRNTPSLQTNQLIPIQVLKGNEDIWCTKRCRAKSARK